MVKGENKMNIFRKIDNYLGDMGPWYLGILLALLLGLAIIYIK